MILSTDNNLSILIVVFTKATDIHFRKLWLAPLTRNTQDYSWVQINVPPPPTPSPCVLKHQFFFLNPQT